MKLVYFEDENGNSIAIAASHIVAIQQKRMPTNLPSIVWLVGGQHFQVRNSFEVCQKRLMLTEES